jgi:hypothetical protein
MGEIRLRPPARATPEKSGCCWECGELAPTKHVEFWQIIGAGIFFRWEASHGQLCKSCIHGYFWQYTLITLGLGWWSVTSFLLTPFVLLHNLVRYLLCLPMPRPPKPQPTVTKPVTSTRTPFAAPAAENSPWWAAWS